MEALKVAKLIEALNLVGQVYRNKDGTQPADAVKKILQQLKGAEEMTLVQWATASQSRPKAAPKRAAKSKAGAVNIDAALATLETVQTQTALREAVAGIRLSAAGWQELAKTLTGRAGNSGKAARQAVETYLSDRLLLNERVESVKRQFAPITPPPAVS